MANSEPNGTANILGKGKEVWGAGGRGEKYIYSICFEKLKTQGHETHQMVIQTALHLVEDKRECARGPGSWLGPLRPLLSHTCFPPSPWASWFRLVLCSECSEVCISSGCSQGHWLVSRKEE